jgi:hypothetical protein
LYWGQQPESLSKLWGLQSCSAVRRCSCRDGDTIRSSTRWPRILLSLFVLLVSAVSGLARDWFRRIYRLRAVVDKQKQYVRPRSTALIALSHDAGTKSLNSDSGRAYQALSVAREPAESHGMGHAVYRQSFSCSVLPGKDTNTQTSHKSMRVSACALREGGCGFVS